MIYQLLSDYNGFPPTHHAEKDGLLAIGGDLSPERLLTAYSLGIFPWFNPGDEILWWAPPKRAVFNAGGIKISKSLQQSIRNKGYKSTFDTAFEEVIENCSNISRNGQEGTWISDEMKKAYINLHELGFAHSVETWRDGKLVGGLYGISLGSVFFGESMFHKATDASKIALVFLSNSMLEWGFSFIDAQMHNSHLESLGVEIISRAKYQKLLQKSLQTATKIGKW